MALRLLSTFTNRFLTALLNLGIVVATAHSLGAEGRGHISLLALGVTINQTLAGIVGGAALTYLVPRHGTKQSILLGGTWALFICMLGSTLLTNLKLIDATLAIPLALLSLGGALLANQQSVLLAQQRIYTYNFSAITQPFILLAVFSLLSKAQHSSSVSMYVMAAYLASLTALLVAYAFSRKTPATIKVPVMYLCRRYFFHGGWSQLANLAQLLNYRFSYYCIESFGGISQLGVFSTAMSISEAVWMFSKSISTVQYSQAVNSSNLKEQQYHTILFLKLSTLGTMALTLVLLLMPTTVYDVVFGKDFSHMQSIILHLTISVVAVSSYTVLAHYFSGTGRHNISSHGSLIGLAVTIPASFILIPHYGLVGAAWAANLSHVCNGLYLLIRFSKESATRFSAFVPQSQDIVHIDNVLKML